MATTPKEAEPRPYPETWEQVAELRVFRTTTQRWQSLITWRRDMRKKGWRLLKVSTHQGDILAVFGRTRDDLLARSEAAS